MAIDGLRSGVHRTIETLRARLVDRTATAFACPACLRMISRGTLRCDGCGTRLILDVPATRASVLLGVGLAAGLLVGVMAAWAVAPREVAAPAAPAAVVGPAPSDEVTAQPVPASAGAALRGTTALNGRLAADAEPLSSALHASAFPTADVIRVLRRMASTTRVAAGMVAAMGAWPEAAAHQVALSAFYAELAGEIDLGLSASVHSDRAYRAAAKAVLRTLEDIGALDAEARALAASADLDLPPIVIPAVLR